MSTIKRFIKKTLKGSPIPFSKNHLYDIQTEKIMKKVLTPNSNCIDVGCFEGEMLSDMIKFAPKGLQIGVEPIPVKFNALQEKFEADNCLLLNMAASNVAGETTFNYVVSNPSYSGMKKRAYDRKNEVDEEIVVKTAPLDESVPSDLKIDFIKIDVEGAELLVLEGAKKIIHRDKPVIVFEHGLGASEFYGTKPKDVFSFFEQLNMKVSLLSRYLSSKPSLSLEEFERHFNERLNYYFIAYA